MKSMKMYIGAKEETEEAIDVQRDEYPYGLMIDLNMECLEKLDKALPDFKPGQDMSLSARVKVKRIDMSEDEDGVQRGSVELQITHMDLVDKDSESEAFKEAFKK